MAFAARKKRQLVLLVNVAIAFGVRANILILQYCLLGGVFDRERLDAASPSVHRWNSRCSESVTRIRKVYIFYPTKRKQLS